MSRHKTVDSSHPHVCAIYAWPYFLDFLAMAQVVVLCGLLGGLFANARPEVKLAINDPSVSAQFLSAIAILRNSARQPDQNAKYREARAILLLLAEAGYADVYDGMAASYLAYMYYGAHSSVEFSWLEGLPWLILAADAGHTGAQSQLGTLPGRQ